MKVLAMDSSSKTATVALLDENGIIGEYSINYLRHSVILMPMIDELLKKCDVSINHITHIAVSEGPGSFTGLRIGAATAKGLAHALNIPIVGVSSLLGLAYNVYEFEGLICPIIDALNENVYAMMIKGGSFEILKETDVYSLEAIAELVDNYSDKVLFVGEGVYSYKDKLEKLMGDKALFAKDGDNIARASSIGEIALQKIKKGEVTSFFDFKPVYIRKSAAEIRLSGEGS
ncbi:tRNA threonylcarbamoyladenosine biosynthesis protein TsaB [Thermoanaerobacter kivui]|uniref:tRNA threonylcarbamoyladenosine biosynthesis protein TsaB n=1 Tax=Thermoanaerobacter kivui TaxID=2325 RepID=A0A097API7_THEKI|nr:tRNA (adenosine(37)-N6)-threonylcarbamoyltransferase complex dimerization subunit type 1 TsaB [Thermoanaerobacter kivui]AIS51733.1 tRNA threonylcarbamoyladenosine biosynthesis protein TsaB [Thermoanaerobacter kivui]